MIGMGRLAKGEEKVEVSVDLEKLGSFISAFHRRKREERSLRAEEDRKQAAGGQKPKIMSGPIAGKLKKLGHTVEQR